MHLQRVWTCTPQLLPPQSCTRASCSTEHVKIQIHLAEKFCSQLLAWQSFGWGGEEGGREFSKQWGKTVQNFHHQWPWHCWSQRKQHHPSDSMWGNHSDTNKKSPAFISIVVAYAKLPLVKSSFLLHRLPPAVDGAGYLLKQAGNEWDILN